MISFNEMLHKCTKMIAFVFVLRKEQRNCGTNSFPSVMFLPRSGITVFGFTTTLTGLSFPILLQYQTKETL